MDKSNGTTSSRLTWNVWPNSQGSSLLATLALLQNPFEIPTSGVPPASSPTYFL
jgi:hypothetical protein